jgi:hypothetical protein
MPDVPLSSPIGTLGYIRELLVRCTGRYDLYENGSDVAFINMGQELLDSMFLSEYESTRHYMTLSAGAWYLFVPSCRAIKEVRTVIDGGYNYLTKVPPKTFRSEFGVPSSSGTVGYYAILEGRATAESGFDTTDFPVDPLAGLNKTVVFNALAEVDTTIEFTGSFYTTALGEDSDVSAWTGRLPMLLVAASAYNIAIFEGAAEQANLMMSTVMRLAQTLRSAIAEQELAEPVEAKFDD